MLYTHYANPAGRTATSLIDEARRLATLDSGHSDWKLESIDFWNREITDKEGRVQYEQAKTVMKSVVPKDA